MEVRLENYHDVTFLSEQNVLFYSFNKKNVFLIGHQPLHMNVVLLYIITMLMIIFSFHCALFATEADMPTTSNKKKLWRVIVTVTTLGSALVLFSCFFLFWKYNAKLKGVHLALLLML